MGYLLGLIPLLTFAALAVYLQGRWRERALLRESILAAVVICGGWLVLGTEGVSLVHGIYFWTVLAWWGAPLVVLMGLIVRERRRIWAGWPARPRGWWRWVVSVGFLLPILFILTWCFLQAFFAPPTNGDSLAY